MKEYSLQDLSLNITDGKHGDCQGDENSGFYFISCKDVLDGQIQYDSARQITKKAFEEANKRTKLEVNDILVTNSGTIGRMALVKDCVETGRTTFQKSVAIIKPCQDVIVPQYFYYLLLSKKEQLINDSNGAAQKNLLLSTMRAFKLMIHEDIDQQHRVAGFLSAYDDLIENNQKQIKLLEEAAIRLYKEWFIYLCFPGHENARIVNGVPEGWEHTIIEDVCQTVGGGTPSTTVRAYYDNGNILWVTPTDITRNDCNIILDTEKKITEAGLKGSSSKLLPPETILMTSRASVGYFGLCEKEVCTNQGFISCIPNKENLRMYLLYNLMNRVDEIRQKAGGATYAEINKSTFRKLNILLPADDVLTLFQENVYSEVKKIRALKKSVEKCKQARDMLLPKLMSGEIEV